MFKRMLIAAVLVLTTVTIMPSLSFAQQGGRWVREFFGHYFDADSAARVAQAINNGQSSQFRNATSENVANAVTGTFGVYAERYYPDKSGNGGVVGNGKLPVQGKEQVVNGQLTKGSPLDTLRKGHHFAVHTFQLTAGQEYTIDLMSGDGKAGSHNPGYFDTWLRVEEANGNVLRQDDDGGEGYNSRTVFTPTQTGTYRLVVTTYSQGATGSYSLRIRY